MPMRSACTRESSVLAMEREGMPTSDTPPLTERAKARQTLKRQWPQQGAANQAQNTDMPLQVTVAAKVMAVARVSATVAAKGVATVAVMVVATPGAMVGEMPAVTAAPSNPNNLQ